MKKIALLTIIASILLLTSCQDAIFEAIRMDVKPEDPTVSGNIPSITRCTIGSEEYLVLAADGGIRYKQKDQSYHDAWSTGALPFEKHKYNFNTSTHSGEQLLTVLSSGSWLYLISAEYSHTTSEGLSYPTSIKLRGKNFASGGSLSDSSGWTLITDDSSYFPIVLDEYELFYTSDFRVFQTNAPKTAHRAAFIRSKRSDGYHYYKLNGSEDLDDNEINSANVNFSVNNFTPGDADYDLRKVDILSAVHDGSGVLFFTSQAATTNETYSAEPTCIYVSNGDSGVYYRTIGTSVTGTLGTGSSNKISALATCSNSLLIGFGSWSNGYSGGIKRANLDANHVPSMGSFDSNAQFQITGNYAVMSLLNATPEQDERHSSLYASITFAGGAYNFENVGLWSYYPDRDNWNRE